MFRLEIRTDNAAFESDEGRSEIATILNRVVMLVESGWSEGKCMDSNGNTVGTWSLSEG